MPCHVAMGECSDKPPFPCPFFTPPQKDLAQTKAQVEQLNTELAALSKQFEEKTAEQQDLKAKADLMERRLNAASRLIAGLGSERSRWSADITELDARKEKLVGDCLLTSSFLSYTGAFTFNYREWPVGGARWRLRDKWLVVAAPEQGLKLEVKESG